MTATTAKTTRRPRRHPALPKVVTAAVVGENRTIDVVGGKFTDMFAANAAHIYKLDLAAVTCN
jgi:hypothetical protein